MIDLTKSVLPHLGSFAGIAFALKLAYIGLPRFRYRERIQEYVSVKLGEIDGQPHQFLDTDWHKSLLRLAYLRDNPEEKSQSSLPQASWASGYSFWFEKHLDRRITIFWASFLGCFTALGCAHSAGFFGSFFGYDLMFLFSGPSFLVWFFLLVFASLTPVFLVARGNSVVDGAFHYSDVQIRDMKITMKAEVAQLKVPKVTY